VLFVGIDWSEAHHDVCVLDAAGRVQARRRILEGVQGIGELHALVAAHADEDEEVVVGLETDRGLLVEALLATDYQVYAINPLAVSRYRERHTVSRGKSDPGDAKVLADLVRTDRHIHRPLAIDSDQARAIKVLARDHKDLIWQRQRHANKLRNRLREYYPAALAAFGGELAHPDAVEVLARAPTPEQGCRLSTRQIVSALRRGGRRRRIEARALEIREALRTPQLQTSPALAEAYADTAKAAVAVISELNAQIQTLEERMTARFEAHPDAEIITSLPGLSSILGARVLGEFGDNPTRFAHAKGRKAYAGTAPITRASGRSKVVRRRIARNKRLADACQLWAFGAVNGSPGARHYYDRLRDQGASHNAALRSLANRLVGILHGCLNNRQVYNEEIAWPAAKRAAA